MVEEVIPWCRPCEQFHQESTCYVANQVMEHGIPKVSNVETNSSDPDHIYMVGQAQGVFSLGYYCLLNKRLIISEFFTPYLQNWGGRLGI